MQLCDTINGFLCNVKGNRTSHDAVDKSSSKQQICDSTLIVLMVRENWIYMPSACGSYSRLTSRLKMGEF